MPLAVLYRWLRVLYFGSYKIPLWPYPFHSPSTQLENTQIISLKINPEVLIFDFGWCLKYQGKNRLPERNGPSRPLIISQSKSRNDKCLCCAELTTPIGIFCVKITSALFKSNKNDIFKFGNSSIVMEFIN